jgi:F-type H+-transporting ATPase subunit c
MRQRQPEEEVRLCKIYGKEEKKMDAEGIRMLAAGLAMGLGAIGPGIGIGILGYGAMQALGRNPEARGPIMTNMILAIAFAEAIGIYALIVAILIAGKILG